MNAIQKSLFAVILSVPLVAGAQVLGTNLVVNGDAESDVGSTSASVISTVTGFGTSGQLTAVQYAAGGGFPTASDPGPASRGLNFFAGGNTESSAGIQTIALGSASTPIDAGLVTFQLSGFLGGFSSQADHAAFSVSFLDASSGLLGTYSIGPVTNADRGDATGLLYRELSGLVPTGTRSAQVALNLTRLAGSYNDGYADNLSLVLSPVPEPESAAMLALGLALVGWTARTRRKAT